LSQAVLIAFAPEELGACAAFGASLGAEVRVVLVGGSAPADALAAALVPFVAEASVVAGVSSMRAKDVLARLAGLLDAGMISDVVETVSATVFRRPMYAGAILATVEIEDGPVVITFRPAGYVREEVPDFEVIELVGESSTQVLQTAVKSGGRPSLQQARTVVSGGRPLRDAETFERVVGGLADALGGAVGATRAAVDAGIAPNELQVGQTGKVVAPDLYIAAGISGSTQHMAGIKDSRVIVAINRDPDAPIFQMADIGLVADLFEALPRLQDLVTG